MSTYTHKHIHAHTRTCTHARARTHADGLCPPAHPQPGPPALRPQANTHTHIRTHAYTHTHAHTHVHALTQMASALQHIHNLGLAHLDLKPDNIYRARPTSDSAASWSGFGVQRGAQKVCGGEGCRGKGGLGLKKCGGVRDAVEKGGWDSEGVWGWGMQWKK